jgi:hypothetical protein
MSARDWLTTNSADAELGPRYECHYCGDHFQPGADSEKLMPSEYDAGLDVILVCDRPVCQALYEKETDASTVNIEGLATLIERFWK